MSFIESSREEVRKRAIGWSIAALISAAAGVGGIYGWMQEERINPARKECSDLGVQVLSLETELFKNGTLGSDGGLLIRYLEVRNPDDPQLRPWGQLKNKRDRACAESQMQYTENYQGLNRAGAIVGIAGLLLSVRMALDFRRRLGRQ